MGIMTVKTIVLGRCICRTIKKCNSAHHCLTCACCNRRHDILGELKKRGISIHVAGYNVWGANLTLLIRRSKIVLNLHFYDARTLETCRIMESLSLGALVSAATQPPECLLWQLVLAFCISMTTTCCQDQ